MLPTGFTVLVPGHKVMEKGAGIASRDNRISSVHTSNRKKKGEGNVKNGNKYLAWAFVALCVVVAVCHPNEVVRRDALKVLRALIAFLQPPRTRK